MLHDLTDPFVYFVVVVLGSLAMSVMAGTIDACRNKGTRATFSMCAGARAMAVLFWFGNTPRGGRRIFMDATEIGRFTCTKRALSVMNRRMATEQA